MIAQVPNLGGGARQSSVDSSRSDMVEMRLCAKVLWLKTGFTLYGCNASRCGMARSFFSTGREPSEKARPEHTRLLLKFRTWTGELDRARLIQAEVTRWK